MTPQRKPADHRHELEKGFFKSVILQAQKILQKNDTQPPADVALYALGETYAHYAYENKDYSLSQYYFEKLLKNFPDSPLAWEARTFISLYENFEVVKSEPEPFQDRRGPFAWTTAPVGKDRFAEAILQNETILQQQPGDAPQADAALYNLGLIYAHIYNPEKDLMKARNYFMELIRKFPKSPLAEEARVWTGLFRIIEKMQRIDTDIELEKKQLSR